MGKASRASIDPPRTGGGLLRSPWTGRYAAAARTRGPWRHASQGDLSRTLASVAGSPDVG